MNSLQIMRKARFEVDALRTGNVKSAMWDDEEILDSLNTAMDTAARIIRLSDSDLLTKSMKSTDDTAYFVDETYVPSTSLKIVSGTTDYTLPPDFVRVVSILPTAASFDSVRFRPAKPYQKLWQDHRSLPDENLSQVENEEFVFQYILLGQRTIRFAPEPREDIDIELLYQYKPPRLFNYSSGTVTVTNSSYTVSGAGGTDWFTFMRVPADLVIATTSPTSSEVSLSRPYLPISAISTHTDLTLKRIYPGLTASAQPYAISMIPLLPEEHHTWLAQMTAALMLRKISIEMSDMARRSLEAEFTSAVAPEVGLRQAQESLPVEPFEIP